MSKINLVVAINNDSLIGIKEYGVFNMPWPYLKDDMNFFRKLTTTIPDESKINIIIVGYNTWQTLPNSYKKNTNRYNIIIARGDHQDSHLEKYVDSFENALNFASNISHVNEIFVIGGSVTYQAALLCPQLKNIYVTHIKTNYPNDANIEKNIYFPLSHDQINKYQNDNLLDLESESVKHDVSKNITMTFKKYIVKEKFHCEYMKSVLVSTPSYMKLKNNFTYFMCIVNLIYNLFVIILNFLDLTKQNLIKDFSQEDLQEESQEDSQEYQYINLVKNIMENGIIKNTRNAITKSIFGYQLKYDLSKGYPIQTVKRSYPKAIFEELMWMIRGQTDVEILQKKGVHIWDKNSSKDFLEKNNLSYEEGDIGPGYGFQFRYYGAEYHDCKSDYKGKGIDQLKKCIEIINNNPHDRRIIINLWNSSCIDKMALAPCHLIYNFGVDLYEKPINGKRGKLNCHLFQRSWDVLLGWNTTTAALLTYIIAHHCNLDPGTLVHSITDAHLYKSHIDSGAVEKLLERIPRKFPTIKFNCQKDNIEEYQFDDISIENYYPCPAIIAEMIA
ncbi:bifunctional dihydrofolate reductase-thymidylate synthase [Cotonvirus japonicus]|uniref:thymidylate synthase n=1 Tax=Cotonvirus japonicus TaxID=2811091 RepID=A0ABM7NSE9_9VIRU|nr:bifunctional dihydrofolate reductase-thymidylate synthase [Cotonvirus japonicus]BCS83036.1 bifunctional dihydrofolate reductase-thymidylate synthase [Cotonvirus japonicus]